MFTHLSSDEFASTYLGGWRGPSKSVNPVDTALLRVGAVKEHPEDLPLAFSVVLSELLCGEFQVERWELSEDRPGGSKSA